MDELEDDLKYKIVNELEQKVQCKSKSDPRKCYRPKMFGIDIYLNINLHY